MASEYVEEYPNQEPQIEEQEEDDGNTTTVQFIAVSAEEHERMVREGELPETIQGMVHSLKMGYKPRGRTNLQYGCTILNQILLNIV